MQNTITKNQIIQSILDGNFTEETYTKLLKRTELDKIDLETEYTKIVKKVSYLSSSKRTMVLELLLIRDLLKQVKEEKEKAQVLTETETDIPTTSEIKN